MCKISYNGDYEIFFDEGGGRLTCHTRGTKKSFMENSIPIVLQ